MGSKSTWLGLRFAVSSLLDMYYTITQFYVKSIKNRHKFATVIENLLREINLVDFILSAHPCTFAGFFSWNQWDDLVTLRKRCCVFREMYEVQFSISWVKKGVVFSVRKSISRKNLGFHIFSYPSHPHFVWRYYFLKSTQKITLTEFLKCKKLLHCVLVSL